MEKKNAIIIGAGPAGLTAAYELLTRTDVLPIVLERDGCVGGLARTVTYKGNRMDIGGHRFFSKSDRVIAWWLAMLPLERRPEGAFAIHYQRRTRSIEPTLAGPNPEREDRVMLVRKRKSRIYFLRQLFDYPLRLDSKTVRALGFWRMARIGASYLKSALFPIRPETNLEQFFINRFGRELYATFFKAYTEKVWGVPCRAIDAQWGRQRIKGLSLGKTLRHILAKPFRRAADLAQKSTETSLIEQFLYPKYGPGQMWEVVAERVRALGGIIMTNALVEKLFVEGDRITAVEAHLTASRERKVFAADHVFSTMPIKDLVRALQKNVPQNVRAVSEGLCYRDFITIGLLVKKLRISDGNPDGAAGLSDNWIYIQEPGVRVGRIQIFNNWSPYLVSAKDRVWLGLEYFCNEADELWRKTDGELVALAAEELESIGVIRADDVVDGTVIRTPKAYPAYFGTYARFSELRAYLDRFENLFLLGRNGMHKYNNQDHSMLTAMAAVDNLSRGLSAKENIWAVNADEAYHETKEER